MSLKLQLDKLEDLMISFYTLTNIKIVIFDENYNEIISYPKHYCKLCTLMQNCEEASFQCMKSNISSFEACKKSKKLLIYHCHAGLVETTAPLLDNGIIIGYIMFGQITDNINKNEFIAATSATCEKYGLPKNDYLPAISEVKYMNHQHIRSSAKILEACTYYLLLNQLVSMETQLFINKLNLFIDDHITEDIPIDRLCAEFNVSKSKLYELCASKLGTGIAKYINNKRIEKAKKFLKDSNLSITEISKQVGFSDYNYFCRVFKKNTGLSAKAYRKIN